MKQAVSVAKGPENHKMGQKAGNPYRIKNKEKFNSGAQRWLGIWGPADWIHGLSGHTEHFQLSAVGFEDEAPQAGKVPSWG